jgi:hypothetical protein
MAAPSAITLYNSFKEYLGDGTFDMNTNSFVVTLHSSTYVPALTHAVAADLTNEVANGNGYTTGGFALTTPAFAQTAGVAKWSTGNNPSWTGSGAGFAARYAVFRAVGTLNARVNPLIGYMLLDSAPADVSFAVTNTVTITQNAAGWFTLT